MMFLSTSDNATYDPLLSTFSRLVRVAKIILRNIHFAKMYVLEIFVAFAAFILECKKVCIYIMAQLTGRVDLSSVNN